MQFRQSAGVEPEMGRMISSFCSSHRLLPLAETVRPSSLTPATTLRYIPTRVKFGKHALWAV